ANPTRRAILDGDMSPLDTNDSGEVGVVSRGRLSDFWRDSSETEPKAAAACGTVEVDGARGASVAVGPRSEAMTARQERGQSRMTAFKSRRSNHRSLEYSCATVTASPAGSGHHRVDGDARGFGVWLKIVARASECVAD